MTALGVQRRDVEVAGRTLEVARIRTDSTENPIVLLHEGLGSIDMWRDFPDRLAVVTGRDVIAYSRYGHGRSEELHESREVTYMHDEACVSLRGLLGALGIAKPVLFGHSDGASIALIYAANFPAEVAALVLEAPHVFVEPLTIESIAGIRTQAASGDLLAKLARYHDDAAKTFAGWNDIWLHPDFRTWNIRGLLPAISVPVLMIQGRDDEYGSGEQLAAIANALPSARTVLLDACGHSPHREYPDLTLEKTRAFLAQTRMNSAE
jgi:pimeloyl-ACP methyl ester carboxylesterase